MTPCPFLLAFVRTCAARYPRAEANSSSVPDASPPRIAIACPTVNISVNPDRKYIRECPQIPHNPAARPQSHALDPPRVAPQHVRRLAIVSCPQRVLLAESKSAL